MFDQSFAVADIFKLLVLIFLEIVLSADNAVVLGVIVSKLPDPLRKKAFYIGYLSAFFVRAAALIGFAFLIRFIWIQVIGAAYLLYLCISYFLRKKKPFSSFSQVHGFWTTIFLVEMTDLIFAIDSIIAGLAFIGSRNTQVFYSKLWIVYVGGMIGILAIRYAAHLFTTLMGKFNNMERMAHLMVGWISLKLFYEVIAYPYYIFEIIFWTVLSVLFMLGFIKKRPVNE